MLFDHLRVPCDIQNCWLANWQIRSLEINMQYNTPIYVAHDNALAYTYWYNLSTHTNWLMSGEGEKVAIYNEQVQNNLTYYMYNMSYSNDLPTDFSWLHILKKKYIIF